MPKKPLELPASYHFLVVLLPSFSGTLLALSFPPFNLGLLVFIALLPLFFTIYKISNTSSNRPHLMSFLAGFVCGLFYFSLLMNWLIYTLTKYGNLPTFFSIILFLILVSYLSLFFGIFSCFLGHLFKKKDSFGNYYIILASLLWVYLEFIREHLFTGLPWGNLGLSLDKFPLLIQIADIVGVYGLTFLIVLTNLTIFNLITTENKKTITKNLVLLTSIWTLYLTYGVISYNFWNNYDREGGRLIHAISLQGNIPQDIKWDKGMIETTIDIYEELTRQLVLGSNKKTLVVLPETAMPFYLFYEKDFRSRLERISQELNIDILTGAPHYDYDMLGERIYKNSAFLIVKGRIIDKYDKYHLVPFGEYIPFGKYFSWLSRYLPTAGDFTSGKIIRPLDADGYRLGVLICFESIFPYITRRLVDDGAQVITIITNDAWFGRSGAPYQHEQFAVFRAIESRRWVIRSANTGVSSIIAPTGERVRLTDIYVRTGISTQVVLIDKKTVFTRYFGFFSIFFHVIILSFVFIELRSD